MSSSYQLQALRSEGEHPIGHIPKARKSVYDPISIQKSSLVQEFKDTSRERSVEARESSLPKTSEHKLRKAFDEILSENNVRKKRLHELNLRLSIMRRDDISEVEVNEKEIEQNIERDIEEFGLETVRKFRGSNTSGSFKGGKDLLEKYILVKKMLEKTLIQKETQEENTRSLLNKVAKMKKDQEILTERIGKRESLYKLMKKRFLDLGTTENTARNKLIRTNNKLLSIKQEMKKQQLREDNYFAKKGVSLNRTQQNLEGLKDTTARNIIYKEDTHKKKRQLDLQLEDALFDEKTITDKRQASEYILLYIQLLETLENGFIKQAKPSSLQLDVPGQKLSRGRSVGSRENFTDEHNQTLRSQSKDADTKRPSSINLANDRDAIITRIAQFYDGHPQGSGVLVQDLLQIYNDLLFKEQTLASRSHELNIERQTKKRKAHELENELGGRQREFILMEEKLERNEEMSPEHARQTEKNVVGKLGQYNQKSVNLAEYLVNICTIGLQDTLTKLKNASSALNKKSGKLASVELIAKVHEIETFLAAKKEDDWQDVTPGRKKGGIKKIGNFERENSHRDLSPLLKPQEIHVVRNKSSTKDPAIEISPFAFEPNSMQSIQTPKESKSINPSHQIFDDKKEGSVRSEEELSKSAFTQQSLNDELNKVEQLFKTTLNVTSEVLHVFREKFIEEKWLLDYLTREDIKIVLTKYARHYAENISEQLLGPIFKDLKDEARQAQKKRTSETFDLLEALLLIYLKQYKKKRQDVKSEFNTQIRSEVLDNPNKVLAISEHIEDVFDAKCKDIYHLSQLDNDHKNGENALHTESDADIGSLGEKTPKAEPVFSARDAIEALHARYIEERRKTSTSSFQYLRSNSAPKIRLKSSMSKRNGDDLSNLGGDESHIKHDDKTFNVPRVLSKSKTRHAISNSGMLSMLKGADIEDGSIELEKKTMRDFFDIKQKRPMTQQRSEAPKRFVPSAYSKSRKTSGPELDFIKKVLKDDQILKKISMLEKKNTEFDQKSKDCERRQNYVPDFSLLGKFGGIRRKENQQSVTQWWNFNESKHSALQERERSQSQLSSPERLDRGSSSYRDYKKPPSMKTFFGGKYRSGSKPSLKGWNKTSNVMMNQTMKSDFRIKVSKPFTSREDSFENYEEKIFNQATSKMNL